MGDAVGDPVGTGVFVEVGVGETKNSSVGFRVEVTKGVGVRVRVGVPLG